MYIPRPAKLLFTVDDGWNRFLEKFGDSVTPWTRLCVERMLACGTTEMGVRRYCCSSSDCTHSRFFCQSCKSKACSALRPHWYNGGLTPNESERLFHEQSGRVAKVSILRQSRRL